MTTYDVSKSKISNTPPVVPLQCKGADTKSTASVKSYIDLTLEELRQLSRSIDALQGFVYQTDINKELSVLEESTDMMSTTITCADLAHSINSRFFQLQCDLGMFKSVDESECF